MDDRLHPHRGGLKPVGSIGIIAAGVSTSFGIALDLLKNGALESAVNTLMYTCIYIFASAETLNNLYHKFKLTMLAIITRNHESRSRKPDATWIPCCCSGGPHAVPVP